MGGAETYCGSLPHSLLS